MGKIISTLKSLLRPKTIITMKTSKTTLIGLDDLLLEKITESEILNMRTAPTGKFRIVVYGAEIYHVAGDYGCKFQALSLARRHTKENHPKVYRVYDAKGEVVEKY